MSALPPWPDETGRCDWGYYQEWKYAEARADAALARLRIAVEALKQYGGIGSDDGPLTLVGKAARDALSAIGSVPNT